ncbi:hypothetical protein ACFU6E_19260 [Bacillus cereus]|uniref:hypothetical protein n=1 Tax=Bacillus cereus TaxID=1396 RepID=UPI00366A7226
MANTKESIQLNSNFPYGGESYIMTSEDSNTVYATYEPAWLSAAYVRLTLQYAVNETWQDIASKTGESWSDYAGKENFNTQFNNIPIKGRPLRIKVDLYSVWNHNDFLQSDSSKIWIR